jgi:hypothetical protein
LTHGCLLALPVADRGVDATSGASKRKEKAVSDIGLIHGRSPAFRPVTTGGSDGRPMQPAIERVAATEPQPAKADPQGPQPVSRALYPK